MMFMCTHGKEDAERASLPFVAAGVAATAGMETLVVCTMDAVWLATQKGAEGVESKGLPPLSKLVADFVGTGGKVWLCGACAKPRGITADQLREGASIVGAASIIEAIAGGATPVSFA